jgi:hypothetical protein
LVVDPGPLQWRSDRQNVGVAIDNDLCVLQPGELGDDIVAELRLAGGAKLITALREQKVAGLDEPGLALQPHDLRPYNCWFCACSASQLLCDTQADNISIVSGTTDAVAAVNLIMA